VRLSAFARRLRGVFVRGVFIVGPLALTVAVLTWIVRFLEGVLSPFLGATHIPGLGVLMGVLIVLLAGAIGGNLVGQHLIELGEEFLLRMPGVGGIYRMAKQLAGAFSPEGPAMFSGLVMIEYPRPEVWSLGFVTKRFSVERDGSRREMAAVYVPTNHVYVGDVIVVPAEKVLETGLSQAQGLEALVSGGAGLPDELKARLAAKA
jgi:uncharacterized membrane protein